jgi:hypothetical protein
MGGLKEQLAKLYPDLIANKPAKHPPYCDSDIPSTYRRFCLELAGKHFTDRRGTVVSIGEEHFPKLLGTKLVSTDKKAKAKTVLASLRAGTFDPALYRIDIGRLRTLFWVPDVICDCHSIHLNAHPVIEADEVYVKHYEKMGASTKIVFILTIRKRCVVTTSFLIEAKDLPQYVRMPPVWQKK